MLYRTDALQPDLYQPRKGLKRLPRTFVVAKVTGGSFEAGPGGDQTLEMYLSDMNFTVYVAVS
jgi:hypothetical protein